jgi:hypothetical protein
VDRARPVLLAKEEAPERIGIRVSHDLNRVSHDPNRVSHDLNRVSHDLNRVSHDLNRVSHDLCASLAVIPGSLDPVTIHEPLSVIPQEGPLRLLVGNPRIPMQMSMKEVQGLRVAGVGAANDKGLTTMCYRGTTSRFHPRHAAPSMMIWMWTTKFERAVCLMGTWILMMNPMMSSMMTAAGRKMSRASKRLRVRVHHAVAADAVDAAGGAISLVTPSRRRREIKGPRDDAPSEPPAVAGAGRAIDAEFDDDHEDDEEAVALRRSRRRRRRRPADNASEAVASDDRVLPSDDDSDAFGAEIFETGGFEAESLEPEGAEEVVAYNIQRNVPTWLEAVDILISANVESRKRDPKRGGGGGNGRGPRPRRRD